MPVEQGHGGAMVIDSVCLLGAAYSPTAASPTPPPPPENGGGGAAAAPAGGGTAAADGAAGDGYSPGRDGDNAAAS